jgi:ABC-type multidrug transport system ATPase subunit
VTLAGFGKEAVSIGSQADCDIVLEGRGVLAVHAHIVVGASGELTLKNGDGETLAGDQALGPGAEAPFDFQTKFSIGAVSLPLDHPALALALMASGQKPEQRGGIIVGRDPAEAHLVIRHPSVSAVHASLDVEHRTIIDHDSESGTYLGRGFLPSDTPTSLPSQGAVHFGRIAVPIPLLFEIAAALRGQAPPALRSSPEAVPPSSGSDAGRPRHKTIFGSIKMGAIGAGRSIGRIADNDIVVPHPQVSAHHAEVVEEDGKLYVVDRNSANGTYVRGNRIAPGERVAIQSGEKIYLGPMPLKLRVSGAGEVEVMLQEEEARWAGRPLYEIEAWSLFLQVPDREHKGQDKILLDNVAFKALPGDMIALMGPSGAGKTTLLLALNGYLPPTEGLVRINGEDLYDIYDTLRGSIGYVPQDDLVHPELTVYEAVRYSAKLRLPPDYSEQEIDERVQRTLADLGLDNLADQRIGSPEAKILSGGQRKRVNIALELVTDPVILYLDEPTSGLASDDAASLIQLLHSLTQDTGKTLIMTIHQPARDEYEKFTHALILGYGGVPMYFGPTTPDSYQFFSYWGRKHREHMPQVDKLPVDNPRDMFSIITAREKPIYEELKRHDPNTARSAARFQAAREWRQEYLADDNPTYMAMYSGRRAVGVEGKKRGVPERRASTRGQFGLLLSRYTKTKLRDIGGTIIMVAQGPVIGLLIALVFGSQAKSVPAWCLGALHQIVSKTGEKAQSGVFENLATTRDNTGAIFFVVISAIWFGTSNAAREIVRERAIYLRERMVNLGLFNYLMSKFILLSLFSAFQCTVLLAILFTTLGFRGGSSAFLTQWAALVATAVCAVAMGLLLSTLVTSSEAAMALTPIALIPQVVLGGLIVPATTIPKLDFIIAAVPSRWGFEAAVVPERLQMSVDPAWNIAIGGDRTLATDWIFEGRFECSTAQMASDQLKGAWAFTSYETTWMPYAVLGLMTLGLLLVILVTLKRRDPV